MRNATLDDYRWLYEHTDYQHDGLKCARDAMPLLRALLPKARRLLDFGGGRGDFAAWAETTFPGLTTCTEDPATGRGAPWGLYDVVTCFDVLEHLTADDAWPIMRSLLARTRRWLIFTICTDSDVRNIGGEEVQLHVNRAPPEWWNALLREVAPGALRSQLACEQPTRHLFIVEKPCASSR